jgi:hypothetical protein
MGKSATVHDNRRALAAFRDNGVYVQAGYILFDHATTMDELWINLACMREYRWVVSKGAFSEMYAAEGTPYTRWLDRRHMLVRDESDLGNHAYAVLDGRAGKAYRGMKSWHRLRMTLYDKAIDPIATPKALERREYVAFHEVACQLQDVDLDVMEGVLRLADADRPDEEVLDYVGGAWEARMSWFEDVGRRVDALYEACGLAYDAVENPFVCV